MAEPQLHHVQILPLIQSAVAARLELSSALPGNTDLLYLDIALENVVRSAIERGVGNLGLGAAAFVGPLLQNLVRHCAWLLLCVMQSVKLVAGSVILRSSAQCMLAAPWCARKPT